MLNNFGIEDDEINMGSGTFLSLDVSLENDAIVVRVIEAYTQFMRDSNGNEIPVREILRGELSLHDLKKALEKA